MGLFSSFSKYELNDPENTGESYSDFGKVEVYDYDTVTKEFSLRWKDDLSYFDDRKWEKADGTNLIHNTTVFDADNAFY